MKRAFLFVMLMGLLALPAFAAKNSETFTLPWSVQIGDVQLPEGRCEVTWSEAFGTQVQMTLKGEGKKTATVNATVVQGKTTYTGPVTTVVDGVRQLKGFRTKDATFTFVDGAGTK